MPRIRGNQGLFEREERVYRRLRLVRLLVQSIKMLLIGSLICIVVLLAGSRVVTHVVAWVATWSEEAETEAPSPIIDNRAATPFPPLPATVAAPPRVVVEPSEPNLGPARVAIADGNLNKALEELERVLVEFPDFVDGYVLRSDVALKLRQWNRALHNINAALGIDPFNSYALKQKTRVLDIIAERVGSTADEEFEKDECESLLERVSKSIDRNPNNAYMRLARGQLGWKLAYESSTSGTFSEDDLAVLERMRKLAGQAVADYQAVNEITRKDFISTSSKEADVHFLDARMCFLQNDFEGAEKWANLAVAVCPEPYSHRARSRLLVDLGDWQGALADIEKASQLEPGAKDNLACKRELLKDMRTSAKHAARSAFSGQHNERSRELLGYWTRRAHRSREDAVAAYYCGLLVAEFADAKFADDDYLSSSSRFHGKKQFKRAHNYFTLANMASPGFVPAVELADAHAASRGDYTQLVSYSPARRDLVRKLARRTNSGSTNFGRSTAY